MPTDIMADAPLPYFSHVPPPNIRGRKRWPNSLEAQAFPDDMTPTLIDILVWVTPYLEKTQQARLHEVATA